MKYEIKDLEKGRTIKSVQVVDANRPVLFLGSNTTNKVKVIMIDYLDGTQDVFEFNEETLKKIQNMVDSQAQMFVNRQTRDVQFPWFGFNVASSLLMFVGVIILAACNICTMSDGILMGILSVVFAGNAVRLDAKNKSMKKHKIYVSKIMGKLEEYNEILKKENALSKEQNKELVNIINIDKKSVKELEHIGNKIERYNEIEGKSPKKKTL